MRCYVVRYPTGAWGLYSPDGFLHVAATVHELLRRAEVLGVNRRRLAFRYY
jgi:hypothetical protein